MRRKKYNTEAERLAARRESQRKYRQNNKEKIAAYQAEYMAEYMAKYYQANKEKFAEYYQANKEKIAKRYAEWRQNNKEKVAALKAKYYQDNKVKINKRHIEYEAKYRLTPKGRAYSLLKAYRQADKNQNRGECTLTKEWIVDNVFSGQCCHYCGETDWMKLGVDRIDNSLPHTPENCVPCCVECNTKRGTTPYEEYLKLIGNGNTD